MNAVKLMLIGLFIIAGTTFLQGLTEGGSTPDINAKSIAITYSTCNGDVEKLFANFVKDYMIISPETQLKFGRPDQPITYFSPATQESYYQLYEFYDHYEQEIKTIDKQKLSQEQLINLEILQEQVAFVIQEKPFKDNTYLFTHMFNYPQSLISNFERYPIESLQDAEGFISCMQQLPVLFDQAKEWSDLQVKNNILPPSHSVRRLRDSIHQLNKLDAYELPIYSTFEKKIKLMSLTGKEKRLILARVLELTEKTIIPAFKNLETYLISLESKADDKIGIWKLPNGDAYYQYILRYHTNTNYTPEQIHQIGLSEVTRIQKEMIELIHKEGISSKKDFRKCMKDYYDYVGSKDELYILSGQSELAIAEYNKIIKETELKLPSLFSLIPKAQVEVKVAPLMSGGGSYYEPPTTDGSKGGIFFTRLDRKPFIPAMKTLCYHETIPGHHLQIAIEQESNQSRKFKNLYLLTGFVEGWALYSERLARENGFFTTNIEKIENLNSELFRAMRLVLDTGIHYKRWTRKEASEYYESIFQWNGYPEIDRYSVWPGQACSYKIGELKFLELRNLTQKELGKDFEIRDFHRIVLENGAMPLNLLDKKIKNYIKETQLQKSKK